MLPSSYLRYKKPQPGEDWGWINHQGASTLTTFLARRSRSGQIEKLSRAIASNRAGDPRSTDTAIAVRVLGEVLLVVVFSVVELRRIHNFSGNVAASGPL